MSPSDALTPNLLGDWLDYLGIQTCTCEWAWRGLGVLYGQSFGKGWVRISTADGCPHHQALADAGVNGKPADGDTIARLAAQVRQTLTKPEDTP